jgi:hypothetical protein
MSSGFKTMAEYYRIQSITVKSSLLKNSKWNKYEFNSNLEVPLLAPFSNLTLIVDQNQKYCWPRLLQILLRPRCQKRQAIRRYRLQPCHLGIQHKEYDQAEGRGSNQEQEDSQTPNAA